MGNHLSLPVLMVYVILLKEDLRKQVFLRLFSLHFLESQKLSGFLKI